MYIGYLNGRQELGFSCSKDSHAVKQLFDLKNILKNPAIRIIRKGKQTVIFIFSKEVLVAVFIFLSSNYIESKSSWFPDSEGFTPLANKRVISNQELDSLALKSALEIRSGDLSKSNAGEVVYSLMALYHKVHIVITIKMHLYLANQG
jgi:hypothetical protein